MQSAYWQNGMNSSGSICLANFINGKFVEPQSGTYLESLNPSTGKLLCLVPDSDSRDIEEAVNVASKAFDGWSRMSRAVRAKCMNRLADLLEARMHEFAEAESKDQGKTMKQALTLEIPRCVTNLRFFAELVQHMTETATTLDGVAQSITVHEPIGVVGVISPWNLPLYLLTWKIAPALAMGNCVIAKPSELTSLTAFMLAGLVKEAGFPDGVLNIVFGAGNKAGQSLVIHPLVPAISFTGGTVTGRKIAALAGPLGKRVSLELGGKNAAILFADCNLDQAVEANVRAAFANQGEICLCCSRIYVHRPIYQAFLDKFVAKVGQLRVGDPSQSDTDMGAVVSEMHHDKIHSYFELARSEKAEICCGGTSLLRTKEHGENGSGGFFLTPTVLANVDPQSRLMKEEIFGPIACVAPFDTEEQVINLANNVDYGLAASIWTVDGQRGQRVARQIKTGVVWINCWMVRDLATPFGGVKASGYGREGGKYSLEFFSDVKTITTAL